MKHKHCLAVSRSILHDGQPTAAAQLNQRSIFIACTPLSDMTCVKGEHRYPNTHTKHDKLLVVSPPRTVQLHEHVLRRCVQGHVRRSTTHSQGVDS